MLQTQEYRLQGFDVFDEHNKCPDPSCPYYNTTHFHCNQNRCLYVTNKEDVLTVHSRDFHDNIEILDGFEFYDRNVDCKLSSCVSNKINRHFHCTRPNCNYSFVQYSTMVIHNQKHLEDDLPQDKIKTEIQQPDERQENHDAQMKAVNLSHSGERICGKFYFVCNSILAMFASRIPNQFDDFSHAQSEKWRLRIFSSSSKFAVALDRFIIDSELVIAVHEFLFGQKVGLCCLCVISISSFFSVYMAY